MKFKDNELLKRILASKTAIFFRKYGGLVLLLLFTLFILTYHLQGVAVIGDEALYSQIARENINRHSFLDFYWNNGLWYEKPPLLIWLTMLSFRLFGISEMSARFFPIIFGILGIAATYFLGQELFKSRLAGFLSGFILICLYPYMWFARKNMMDVPLIFFSTLALYAYWKGYQGKKKWYYLAGLFLGCAVMTKSVIGLIPLAVFWLFLLIFKEWKEIKSKYFLWSLVVASVVIIPWHLAMSLRHGWEFWNSYLFFQVWYRFIGGLHTTAADKGNIFFYLEKFWKNLSVFGIIFVFSLFYASRDFLKKNKKQLTLLFIWLVVILVIFSLSRTKLLHYVLPATIPFACLVGWMLASLYEKRSEFLLLVSGISLLNLLGGYAIKLNESGEGVMAVAYLASSFSKAINSGFMVILIGWCIIFCLLYWKNKKIASMLSLGIFLVFSILLPFRPNKNEWVKDTGKAISILSAGKPVIFNVEYGFKYPSQTVQFYLPVTSKFWYINQGEKMIPSGCTKDCVSFCFVEDPEFRLSTSKGIYEVKAGNFFPCTIAKS